MLTPEQLDMIERLQPFFRKKMGEWQKGDEGYCEEHGLPYLFDCIGFDTMCCDSEGLRIPKPIDWQNPERGLWGMLDWKQWMLGNEFQQNGTISMYRGIDNLNICGDPFTALLKALCEQEGV